MLLVGVCVLWVRSRTRYDVFRVRVGTGQWVAIGSNASAVELQAGPYGGPSGAGRWVHERLAPSDPMLSLPGSRVHAGGLGAAVGLFPRGPLTNSFVAVPYWLILIAILATFAVPARRQWRRWRGSDRVRGRRCVARGYDHRATPDWCPECGAVPARQPDPDVLTKPLPATTGTALRRSRCSRRMEVP